jgi:hypothetical protein
VSSDTATFAKDYLAYNLLRKSSVSYFGVDLPSQEELVQKAVSGFLAVEQRCSYINKFGYIPGTYATSDMLAPEVVIHTARRKIAALLKEFDLDEFATSVDFSNGASTRLPRKRSAVPNKFTGKPHVTRKCALLAVSLIWHHEPWRIYCQERYGRESDPCSWVKVVRGSEYFTVPKTWDSLRGAEKNPELNMLCQKAIGSMIRRRLKRVRIDLNDQTYNQYLAGCGSRTGSLATIDLESASDSVSLKLLELLLPGDWSRFITMTRSEEIKLPDGSWHTLEKVSSMGNGFTFELESLIFWAITSAVVDLSNVSDRRIGVYGDDIICHHSVAPSVILCLNSLGFVVNQDKTWLSGPFRESCGVHYHNGLDVTPFHIKGDLANREDCFHAINSLNAWVARVQHSIGLSSSTHSYVTSKLLPKGWGFIPPHLGTKAGIIPPSITEASGVYFCLRKQEYRFRVLTPPSPKGRVVRKDHTYLTWLLNAMHERLSEASQMIDDTLKVSRPRYRMRGSSMWPDSNVRLAGCLLT